MDCWKGVIEMNYRFYDFQVENISNFEFERMLDIVIDMYLGIEGTDEEEIKEAFESEGLIVTEVIE